MKLEIYLKEENYLEFLMFNSGQSSLQVKQRNKQKNILTVLFFLIGIFLFSATNKIAGVILVVIAVLFWFLWPKYLKNKFENVYRKFIADSYEKKLDRKISITLNDDSIQSKDLGSETTFQLSEVEKVVEIKQLMLIYISKTSAIIIPKKYISDQKGFESFFKNKNIPVIDEVLWKWD